jgi:SAM-dependent methyltransferase
MNTYALGSGDHEQQRLELQAAVLNEPTERCLRAAGLEPCMRVLDLGCGVGDVAMLAARIVGSGGEVVAGGRDPALLETARRRVEREGLPVRFVEADVTELDLDGESPFDAAIGRLILEHLSDAVAALRAAASHVRPGGIVAFQEFTPAEVCVHPRLPKTQLAIDRINATFELMGADVRGGYNLRANFLSAGLPEPELHLEAMIGGPDHPVFRLIQGVTHSLRPAMEDLGVMAPAEIDADVMIEELREEVERVRGVVVGPPLVSAWARVAGQGGATA